MLMCATVMPGYLLAPASLLLGVQSVRERRVRSRVDNDC